MTALPKSTCMCGCIVTFLFATNSPTSSLACWYGSHPGNRKFINILAKHCPIYDRTINAYKKIAQKILDEIKSSGGRFLDSTDKGRFHEVDDDIARQKVMEKLWNIGLN